MRLIDADARVTVQSFDAMNEEYNHDEMTVEQALDFATDEGCPPTIDAIPVSWLEKRRENLILAAMVHSTVYGDNSIKLCHAVNVVLDMWQKEQETRNESKV